MRNRFDEPQRRPSDVQILCVWRERKFFRFFSVAETRRSYRECYRRIARRYERGKSCGRRRTATAKRYGNAVAPRGKALQRTTPPKLFRRRRNRCRRVRSVRPSYYYGARSESHDDGDDGSFRGVGLYLL